MLVQGQGRKYDEMADRTVGRKTLSNSTAAVSTSSGLPSAFL
jgi:hypothetical protein